MNQVQELEAQRSIAEETLKMKIADLNKSATRARGCLREPGLQREQEGLSSGASTAHYTLKSKLVPNTQTLTAYAYPVQELQGKFDQLLL